MDLSNDNILHVKHGDIEYLQFRKLLEYDELVHCYTMRKNMDFRRNFPDEKIEIVEKSYEKICNSLNINKEDIVRPLQSHRLSIMQPRKQEVCLERLDLLKRDMHLMLL